AADDTVSVVIAGERYQSEFDGDEWSPFTYVGNGSGTFAGTFNLDEVTGVLTITNTDVSYTVTSARQEIDAGYTGAVPAEDISGTDPVGMDIGQRLRYRGFTRTVVLFSNT